jgi:NPCBM-associated, NEW3 domain of alpha-galactosidase
VTDGRQTAVSANTGHTTLKGVQVSLQAPAGWTVTATSPASFAAVAPGQQETTSWQVTSAAGADGGYRLIASAGYTAPDSASLATWYAKGRGRLIGPLAPFRAPLTLAGASSA